VSKVKMPLSCPQKYLLPMRIVHRSVLLPTLLCCAASSHAAEINLIEQLQEGGAAILLTLALSILVVAVTAERLVHFRAKAVVPEGLAVQAQSLWAARNHAALANLLEQEDSTLARIIAFMSRYRDQPHAFVSSGASDIAAMELRHEPGARDRSPEPARHRCRQARQALPGRPQGQRAGAA
jgi:hypothetical protein